MMPESPTRSFRERLPDYTSRVEVALDQALPATGCEPARLHEAMRYAVLNGGKRIRPLLVYATGELLNIDPQELDPLAVAIEFIHAFSLVHDDLPAMDNDDLRRGRATVHRQFDEACAILAADALQPLAFEVLARAGLTSRKPLAWLNVANDIAHACGSLGMTGGQAIDVQSEGQTLTKAALTRMHELKTGRLICACVAATARLAEDLPQESRNALTVFGHSLGLAFQIKDDILDVEGETHILGKTAGSDEASRKATWPLLFGLEDAEEHCNELYENGLAALTQFGDSAHALRWIAEFIIERDK